MQLCECRLGFSEVSSSRVLCKQRGWMLIFPSQCKFHSTFPFQSSYYLFFTFIILSILLLCSVNFACGTINLGTKYLALAARMKTLKKQVLGFSNRFLCPWSLHCALCGRDQLLFWKLISISSWGNRDCFPSLPCNYDTATWLNFSQWSVETERAGVASRPLP